jgi:hypothetical protein
MRVYGTHTHTHTQTHTTPDIYPRTCTTRPLNVGESTNRFFSSTALACANLACECAWGSGFRVYATARARPHTPPVHPQSNHPTLRQTGCIAPPPCAVLGVASGGTSFGGLTSQLLLESVNSDARCARVWQIGRAPAGQSVCVRKKTLDGVFIRIGSGLHFR